MPELPELEALAEGLTREVAGARVRDTAVWQAAAVKSVEGLDALVGATLGQVRRRGKVLVVDFGERSLLVHLMRSGRLGLHPVAEKRPGRAACFALRLDDDRELRLREAATEHRAGAWVVPTHEVAAHPSLRRLGPEPLGLSPEAWRAALAEPSALLHVALRDGRRVAGIGRAYATDIMWAGRLAPFARTSTLDEDAWRRLARAADVVLGQALERARAHISTDLPTREARVTIAHGQAGAPCVRCGCTLERVSFNEYELVYCPDCQTGGKRYADRRMSRLLR